MTPSVSLDLPYVDFATFLQRHFPGQKVQKITLTAGFSCPTRDGSMGKGGCTYCNNKSFSPNYATKLKSITEQINEGIAFFRGKYPEMKYLAYFQSYTNTYGEVEDCIAKYEEALRHEDVVGLIIGTRPDLLGRKVSEGGITTWGIYAGIAVIVFSFLITLAYVWLANGYFEKTTREVVREVQGDASCTNVQEHA